jgi:hypothetical protein
MQSTSILMRRTFPILLMAPLVSGCAAIEGIFKAGVWVGMIAVVLVIALVGFLVVKVRGS